MTRYASILVGLTGTVAGLFAGCTGGSVVRDLEGDFGFDGGGSGGSSTVGPDGSVPVPEGGAVGDACSDDEPCRAGLACASGMCEPGREAAEGQPCVISGECQEGLQCVGATCAPAGTAKLGETCTDDSGCEGGLRCGIVGFAAQCIVEGTADVGQSCTLSGDCFGGLLCGPDSTCAPAPPGQPAFGLPSSPDITCAEPSQGRVVAHFEVPGAEGADPDGDFFRLPFPNDVRIKDGAIDLSGFPTPGVSPLVGFDPVQLYVDAISETESAWGTYPTVLFRFSGPIDFDSFRGDAGTGKNPVRWLDITDPENIKDGGLRWAASSGGGKYVCHNWFAVRRHHGAVLEPGRVYAVYLTTDGRDTNGQTIQRDAHFEAMLADSPPSDAALAAAHEKYAPLRAYLETAAVNPDTILAATMITTANVPSIMEDLAAATYAADPPTASDWVKCGDGATSPCPQADEEDGRACGEDNANYDEYHALVELPIFQTGTPPYFESGGGIDTSGPARTEAVCMALTIPKGATMPDEGWPLVVFGHGSGGSFRSHIRPEVAGALAGAVIPGSTVPIAVLGYDAVQHGPRRGTSTETPNNLFFNFRNPAAARGNPLQGAADVIAIGRFAASLDAAAADTGGDAIRINPARVLFYGHSQGSLHGSLGLPYASEYGAAVLSGNGASLMHALLSKTEPVNIAAGVPLLLGDFDTRLQLTGGENHPVLTLVQQWIDPGDPLNFARLIAREPAAGMTPKHVFQTYGLGDTYSPPLTMENYAIAAGLSLVEADPSVGTPDDIGGLMEQPAPLADNLVVADEHHVTIGIRQYQNAADRDGHFVVFDVESATDDVTRFLGMAANGVIPQIGE